MIIYKKLTYTITLSIIMSSAISMDIFSATDPRAAGIMDPRAAGIDSIQRVENCEQIKSNAYSGFNDQDDVIDATYYEADGSYTATYIKKYSTNPVALKRPQEVYNILKATYEKQGPEGTPGYDYPCVYDMEELAQQLKERREIKKAIEQQKAKEAQEELGKLLGISK